ncbi:Dynamin family protein [Penicillium cosmopolitanum]|uniref:Dynamin family protein n=1 Tax=Penicillium cosmopolitanum TaxID=1131564 RepID=A0A9W9WA00_9EURO|nr:Dynamin family protein [Penicillium cosmopolitanum]KAJ5409012.1 Dynamin family protein [Penicillium cosmopolitanum]
MTYNHYFTDKWQNIKQQRLHTIVKDSANAATVTVREKGYGNREYISSEMFHRKIDNHLEQNMDKYSAQQALDVLDAYYSEYAPHSWTSGYGAFILFQNTPANLTLQSERKYFTDVVVKQVIERHLVASLSEVFSPIVLTRYNDQEIHFLAFEQPEMIQTRENLQSNDKTLQESQKPFRIALGHSM